MTDRQVQASSQTECKLKASPNNYTNSLLQIKTDALFPCQLGKLFPYVKISFKDFLPIRKREEVPIGNHKTKKKINQKSKTQNDRKTTINEKLNRKSG